MSEGMAAGRVDGMAPDEALLWQALLGDALLYREALLRTMTLEVSHLRASLARDQPTHVWRGASSAAFAVGLDALEATIGRAESALAEATGHTRLARLAAAGAG